MRKKQYLCTLNCAREKLVQFESNFINHYLGG